jgi:hypothetical protein
MKTIIISLAILLTLITAVFGQCGKTVVLTSSKTDHLDASGKLTQSFSEKVVIEISKTTIDISVEGQQKMTGKITSNTCDWKVPFKKGKSVINAMMTNREGDRQATMTIEGKDGKIHLHFIMPAKPDDRVSIIADKFEAKID